MKEAKPNPTPEEQPGICGEAVTPEEEKKKRLDELIEKFNQDSPMKNPKKTYRGVY